VRAAVLWPTINGFHALMNCSWFESNYRGRDASAWWDPVRYFKYRKFVSDWQENGLPYLLLSVEFQIDMNSFLDRLCGLMIRVPGYRARGPGSIPGASRLWEVVGLERGPLSLVSTIEELLGRKCSGSGLESREYGLRHVDHVTPLSAKSWH
jgi:hypothetical protein